MPNKPVEYLVTTSVYFDETVVAIVLCRIFDHLNAGELVAVDDTLADYLVCSAHDLEVLFVEFGVGTNPLERDLSFGDKVDQRGIRLGVAAPVAYPRAVKRMIVINRRKLSLVCELFHHPLDDVNILARSLQLLPVLFELVSVGSGQHQESSCSKRSSRVAQLTTLMPASVSAMTC